MAVLFDVIVAEALDRLSRDQADVAGFCKRMKFAGIRIVALGEGEIAAILALASNGKKPAAARDGLEQVKMVAGG